MISLYCDIIYAKNINAEFLGSKEIASISFSITAYLCCAGDNMVDAKAIGFLSCRMVHLRHLSELSHCIITGLFAS